MQFKEVIGQDTTKSHLRQMVEHNRLSHALLFLGREGSGALPLAMALAQYVVCEKAGGRPADTGGGGMFGDAVEVLPFPTDSCGVCAACQKAAAMIHPDIHYSFPVFTRKSGDKPVSTDFIKEFRSFIGNNPYGNNFDWLQFAGAENKQGNITAAECEDILRKLNLKSFEAGYKILIMWMPEMLRNEGNKLLKLIEEPPPDTLFILVAENDDDILQTILSRTQLIKINLPQSAEIETALVEKYGADVALASQSALVAEGNVREALQHLHHVDENWEDLLRDWLNAILSSGPSAQVTWIDSIAKLGREKQKQFLKFFIHVLDIAVRIQAIGLENMDTSGLEANRTMAGLANKLQKTCDIGQMEAMVKELDQAIYYVERNANAKLLFHALTIRFYHIISNKSVILIN